MNKPFRSALSKAKESWKNWKDEKHNESLKFAKYYMAFYFKYHYGLSMTKVKKILDIATSPCKQDPDAVMQDPDTEDGVYNKEEKVGDFIKENIINKKSEYPEYDNATFESSINDLLNNRKKKEAELYMRLDKDTLEDVLTELGIEFDSVDMDKYEKYMVLIRDRINDIRLRLIKLPATSIKNREDILFTKYITKLLKIAPYVDIFRNLKHVYIINGYARSGKDTFVKMLSDIEFNNTGKVIGISSVQGIKDIASTYFGYDDNNKTDKDRKFLSDFKALTTEYCDYSLENLMRELIVADLLGYSYIFFHIREPKEIDRAKYKLDTIIFPHFEEKILKFVPHVDIYMNSIKDRYMTTTVFITNSRVSGKVTNNESDTNVENYKYDYTIDNYGTLEEFKISAELFAKQQLDMIE